MKCSFIAQQTGIDLQEIKKVNEGLQEELEQIETSVTKKYETEYASLSLPSDVQMHSEVKKLIAQKKKELNPQVLVVIGVGGSNLGTIAVHQVLQGFLYNELSPKIKLYFVDSIDADYTASVLHLVEQELKQNKNVLVNVVTKSGTTTETVVNFELFLQLLKKYKPNQYAQHIVATTDRGSKLWEWAQKEGVATLEVPKRAGGRYSVFSPVGLFPLGFVGVDIDQLCAGAQKMVEQSLQKDIEHNCAALSAATIFAAYKKGLTIHDTFLFSKDLRAVGEWYRQLVGESLGKKVDRAGAVVHAGITPTTSIGTVDLHSVLQLYLAGPRDKFTTFVTIENTNSLQVPQFEEFEAFVAHVQGKPLQEIKKAIVQGVQRAYQHEKRPFGHIELPEKNEFCLGQFLQMKMVELMFLGYLMKVNPFDQPQVELYKKETREVLAKK